MNRSDARTLARTTLDSMGLFGKVFLSEPESFGGYTPVAVVHSKSLALAIDTHDDTIATVEIFVSIYIRRPRDASEAELDAIELRLDELTAAAMTALWAAFDARDLAIGPSEAGYPERTFDDDRFRLERFPIHFSNDEGD